VQNGYNAGTTTVVDRKLAGMVHLLLARLTGAGDRKLDRLREIIVDRKLLIKVLLSFNDQQMVTGFAMLTVALAQIDSMTEYHYAIVQNLSVLSFVVHDTTAVILQDEVVRRPMTRRWRGMIVIGSMLVAIAIQLPSFHYYMMNNYGLPAKCIWTSMNGNYRPRSAKFWLMILWMNLLLYSLVQTLRIYFPNAFGRLTNNTVGNSATSFDGEIASRARHVRI
jgi:hypothetical protein